MIEKKLAKALYREITEGETLWFAVDTPDCGDEYPEVCRYAIKSPEDDVVVIGTAVYLNDDEIICSNATEFTLDEFNSIAKTLG